MGIVRHEKTLLLLLTCLTLGGCLGMPENVNPVSNFQVERYLGKWYEIARLDHSFERGLTSRPRSLEEFTFYQYSQLMCEKKVRWPCFDPVLAQPRDLFMSEIDRINKLRNDFMHFKARSSVAKCNQLRAFRDRTRAAIERVRRIDDEV